MVYTDPSLSNTIYVRKQHINELIDKILSNQSKAKINKVSLSTANDVDANKHASVTDVTKLRSAINILEANYSGNCCQSSINYDCCQSGTYCQTCETWSESCQGGIASCQSCQSCQVTIIYNNCDCNCNDSDSGGGP